MMRVLLGGATCTFEVHGSKLKFHVDVSVLLGEISERHHGLIVEQGGLVRVPQSLFSNRCEIFEGFKVLGDFIYLRLPLSNQEWLLKEQSLFEIEGI